ncbi:MAG: glycosyltransferase [bacterium]
MNKSNNDLLVSIVIPVYNGTRYLCQAIDSALAQTHKNCEVIVVNDGSTDDTEEIVKSYGNKIRYIGKKNSGVSDALNIGIIEAKGQYISWLSHDDVFEPNKIEQQVETLNEIDADLRNKTILFSNYRIINENADIVESVNIENVHDVRKFQCHYYPVVKGLVFGCTTLIPKNILIKEGLFDPSLRTSQDYDMWLRLFPKYNILFMKDYLLCSRKHPGQGTYSQRATEESNAFWIRLMKVVPTQDKIRIDGSIARFYHQMTRQMNRIGYSVAGVYAKEQFDQTEKPFYEESLLSTEYKLQPLFSKIRRVIAKLC